MKRRRALIIIHIFLAMIMLAFNNCGQPGEIRFDQTSGTAVTEHDNQASGNPASPTIPGSPTAPVGSPGNPSNPSYAKVEKTITLSETLKADVLFVIDNSISMAYEQSNMSTRFPMFIKNLKSINWRVGVITTDVDDPTLATSDGRLQKFSNNSHFLDANVPETAAEEMFAEVIQRKETGSGYEQGIYATYRFLEREKASDSPFLRSDSSINVVFITDADETPYNDSNNLPVIQKQNKPEELIKLLSAAWPMKKFQFHSIVVKENDLDCLSKNDNEAYGLSYEKLSMLTNGVKGSVCAEDYGSQLLFLSEKIKDLIKVIELDCVPVVDPVTQKPLFDIKGVVSTNPIEVDRFEGNKVYLKGSLPAGVIKLEYFCPKEKLSN